MAKPKDTHEVGLCGAKKTDGSGGTCRHQAGWGTDHKGRGPCRKHGGCSPMMHAGPEHPTYVHGLYAQRETAEIEEFEAFRGQLDWLRISREEEYLLFLLLKGALGPGTAAPEKLAEILERVMNVRVKAARLLEGKPVRIILDEGGTKQVIEATVELIKRFVPDEVKAEAGKWYEQRLATGAQAAAAGDETGRSVRARGRGKRGVPALPGH